MCVTRAYGSPTRAVTAFTHCPGLMGIAPRGPQESGNTPFVLFYTQHHRTGVLAGRGGVCRRQGPARWGRGRGEWEGHSPPAPPGGHVTSWVSAAGGALLRDSWTEHPSLRFVVSGRLYNNTVLKVRHSIRWGWPAPEAGPTPAISETDPRRRNSFLDVSERHAETETRARLCRPRTGPALCPGTRDRASPLSVSAALASLPFPESSPSLQNSKALEKLRR